MFVGFLQKQLSEGTSALLSCEELLQFANATLAITDEDEFLKVGVQDPRRSSCDFHDALTALSLAGG